MRSYEEAWAAAKDERPFSNGTEGYAWTARDDTDPAGCPLLRVALMGRTPAEWVVQDRFSLGDQYHCTEFREEDEGDDDPAPEPPRWDPEMPGQTTIFEVFADQFVEELATEAVPV